ncbi:MAG: hypothetical protein ABFS86_04200 [Planctomycetota bacterium]
MDGMLTPMKALILILALAAAAGCSSTQSAAREQTPEGVVLLSEEDPPPKSGRGEYSNLRSSWRAHVEDCRTGLDFTLRTMSRSIERDRRRLRWLFE